MLSRCLVIQEKEKNMITRLESQIQAGYFKNLEQTQISRMGR